MSEREPRKSLKHTPHWVPMRSLENGYNDKSIYGSVSWNPNGIYLGKSIAIDEAGVNKLFKLLRMRSPVEIIPFSNPRDEINIDASFVGKKGDVVSTGSGLQKKETQKSLAYISDEDESRKKILIDFESLYKKGEKNPHSSLDRYAKEVDQSFKSVLPSLLLTNIIDLDKISASERSAFMVDSIKLVTNVINILPATVAVLGASGNNIEEEFINTLWNLSVMIITGAVVNQVISTAFLNKKIYKDGHEMNAENYKKYLRGEKVNLLETMISIAVKTSTPYYFIENLFIPLTHIALWKDPLFKKNN